ncbi:MAG: histidine phosphatase family protein [Schwartzia sp.]|nr:histidine phosphatase family protein [Schwartzia sp. (in: firmicutes)]
MKQILLLRHGQSILNLGLAAEDHTLAPLTEEGVRQAEQASRDLPFAPELIASSPYRRTVQTAEPIRKRFPQAKWELWNELHEFTYLEPASCVGLTRDERRPRSRAYWQATDPDYVDGEGAESFRMLMHRAEVVSERLQARQENHIILVSHEQFIKAFLMTMNGRDEDMTKTMRRFKKTPAVGNCETILLEMKGERL